MLHVVNIFDSLFLNARQRRLGGISYAEGGQKETESKKCCKLQKVSMLMDYLYLLISHQAQAYFHVYNFSYRAREKVKVDEKDEKIAELMEEITTLKASV